MEQVHGEVTMRIAETALSSDFTSDMSLCQAACPLAADQD